MDGLPDVAQQRQAHRTLGLFRSTFTDMPRWKKTYASMDEEFEDFGRKW